MGFMSSKDKHQLHSGVPRDNRLRNRAYVFEAHSRLVASSILICGLILLLTGRQQPVKANAFFLFPTSLHQDVYKNARLSLLSVYRL